MSVCKCFILLMSTLLSSPALPAETHCPAHIAGIPAKLVHRSKMVIPVLINGSGPYYFWVDTGAQVSTIDPVLAEHLHLATGGAAAMTGIGSQRSVPYTEFETLRVGEHFLHQIGVVIENLGKIKADDAQISGILGGNVLGNFDLLLDYAHQLLCLDNSDTMLSAARGKHIPLIEVPGGTLADTRVEALSVRAELSGTPAPQLLLLDSGTDVPFLFRRKHSVELAVAGQIADIGDDGHPRMFSILVPQDVRIGPIGMRSISFVTPQTSGIDTPDLGIDGMIPTALFRRVYLSYAKHFAILEP